MDIVTIIAFIGCGYVMYNIGKAATMRRIGSKYIENAVGNAIIPIGVLEKIDNKYYLFEKDTTTFLCQADTIDDIPLKLWESQKISLAAILYPEVKKDQLYWCINGKLKIVDVDEN